MKTFECNSVEQDFNIKRYLVLNETKFNYEINATINKFLLAGDKFMREQHLKQPQFTYSACGPFIKSKERIQKFKETGDTKYIYRNELGKTCF